MASPTPSRFNNYNATSTTKLTADVWNASVGDLALRMAVVEQKATGYQQIIDDGTAVALQQINEVVLPLYEKAAALTSLGAVLSAHSSSTLAVALGTAVFVIDAAQVSTFAYSYWMAAASDDGTSAMSGRVIGFDVTTGRLTMQVMETYGKGTLLGWSLSPSSPPLLTAAVVDGGSYDGTGTTANVPYSYTPTQPASDGGTY